MSSRMEKALNESVGSLMENNNFDIYAGRRLYSYLYDLRMQEIDVKVETHHLIFGELEEEDGYNWFKKLSVALRNSLYDYPEYPGGYEEFCEECRMFFADPRRFTYTPLIACRGKLPQEVLSSDSR
jgi:hypothetical protein